MRKIWKKKSSSFGKEKNGEIGSDTDTDAFGSADTVLMPNFGVIIHINVHYYKVPILRRLQKWPIFHL